MTVISTDPGSVLCEAPVSPAWAMSMGGRIERVVQGVSVRRDGSAAFARLEIPGARRLSANCFEAAVSTAYRQLFDVVQHDGELRVARVWNYLPGIHDRIGDEHDRYRIFNAGRFAAFQTMHGSADPKGWPVPAASGVGHDGEDLVIDALAFATHGIAIENPEQVPAYRYSSKYGRRPPCFCRALRVGDMLLVSGTAAIVGEESRHAGSLAQQFEVTVSHLLTMTGGSARFKYARAYIPRPNDLAIVTVIWDRAFPGVPLECVSAQLCRSELLVEIEAIA